MRVLLLALISFYCILPLAFHTGLPYSQDILFHIFQADQFNQAINNGVFYPRWVPDSNNGYGSPNFTFYSPLSYYVVSAIKFFTPSLTIAMIVAIWCSFFLSGVTMYLAIENMFGGSRALLPAILYQIFPFHLSNIYTRGTFAEIFAFIWFPLIVLFMYKTIASKNKYTMVGLSISYAALILTHLVSGFIFSFVIGAYFIYSYLLLENKKPLIKTFLSLALGLGLSSIYLIPAIFERKFVQIDYIIRCAVGDYKKNFLFTLDKFQPGLLSFYFPLHILIVLETILFLFSVLLIRKNKQILSNRPMQNFFIFLFLFAFFLTIPLSRPIWDIVPGFPYLQFPWRWLPIMEFSLCFLIGAVLAIEDMSSLKPIYLKRVFTYLLIVLALISLLTISKSKVISENLINKIMVTEKVQKLMGIVEYTPIWAKNIEKIMSELKNEKVSVISGTALTDIVEWKSEKRGIKINASTSSLIRIATFYYPGWKAYIDGVVTGIRAEEGVGAMLIDIPEGKHMLILKFQDTPVRYYSKFISLVSLLALTLALILVRKKSQNSK